MKISDNGLSIIKSGEGLKLDAYICPAGVWTIGYGHTRGVKPGQHINAVQADEYLRQDVMGAENDVSRLVKVQLNQNQFDALVSLVFNIGSGNFEKSTLLKKLNTGDYTGAAAEFPRWNRGGGQVLPGLVKRRAAEQALFSRPT